MSSTEVLESVPGGNPMSRRDSYAEPASGRPMSRRPGEPLSQFVPKAPASVEARRYLDVSSGIEAVDIGQPASVQARRSGSILASLSPFVPSVPQDIDARRYAVVPLGDEIMMLEGLGAEVHLMPTGQVKTVRVHQHSPAAKKVAILKVPSSKTVDKLDSLIFTRKVAAAKIKIAQDDAMKRVHVYDHTIRQLAPKYVAAKSSGNQASADQIGAQIAKLNLLRSIVGDRAVKFAKTAGVAHILTVNAATQKTLIVAAQNQAAAGRHPQAQVLLQAAQKLVDQSNEVKQVREQQIRSWSVATQANTAAAADLLSKQATRTLAQESAKQVPYGQREAHEQKLNYYRQLAARFRNRAEEARSSMTAEEAQSLYFDLTKAEREGMVANAYFTVIDGLGGLDDFGNIFKDIGHWVSNAAKDVGHAISNVAKGVGKILGKGACLLATNPAVMGAVGGAVGGPAGQVASGVATSLAQNACGNGTGTAPAPPAPPPPQVAPPEKKSDTIIKVAAIGVPAVIAAAALIL